MNLTNAPTQALLFFIGGFLVRSLLYFAFAGGLWAFLKYAFAETLNHAKIQPRPVPAKILRHEIIWSLSTIAIFSFFTAISFIAISHGYSRMYFDLDQQGWAYWCASIIMLIFIHDTYFYWTHRLLHLPWFYRHVHYKHHVARNPSCFSALNFHPIEALVEGGFIPITIFILPLHPSAFAVWFLIMLVVNVEGHSGYEFRPQTFARHWFWRWFSSATYHNRHHQRGTGNFGLYFFIWDYWMKTYQPDYLEDFEKVTRRIAQRKQQLGTGLAPLEDHT